MLGHTKTVLVSWLYLDENIHEIQMTSITFQYTPLNNVHCCTICHQVLGHTKTVLVLLISWLYLGEVMTGRKSFGIMLAVAGMVAYGYYTGQQGKKAAGKEAPAKAG